MDESKRGNKTLKESGQRSHGRVLKANADSHRIEERIAYASQFIVEAQVGLKSGIIYAECIVVSKFDPNASTEFDIVIQHANGVSKRIQVSDVASFVILSKK